MSKDSEAQLRNLLESITTRLQRGDAVEPLLEQVDKEQTDVADNR